MSGMIDINALLNQGKSEPGPQSAYPFTVVARDVTMTLLAGGGVVGDVDAFERALELMPFAERENLVPVIFWLILAEAKRQQRETPPLPPAA